MRIAILTFLLFFVNHVFSQYDHLNVFPEKEGSTLFQALQGNFTPANVLSKSDSKDTLFAAIYGENDSLACVYSDFTVYMDPMADPSQTVFNNDNQDGINTEHAYPKSKGADGGNAEADMHHLFPTKANVNQRRANFKFGEVSDNSTTNWYYQDIILNTPPNNNIDAYSEFGNETFEPREDMKGNIARANFYFYTIYRNEADAEDPEFFDTQKDDLCDWHYNDPVDEKEWNNTFKIAAYQDNKTNPFVLDCSLAARLYCDNISAACSATNIQERELVDSNIKIFPNPISTKLNIESSYLKDIKRYTITDLGGRIVLSNAVSKQSLHTIYLEGLNKGFYLITFQLVLEGNSYNIIKKLSIL